MKTLSSNQNEPHTFERWKQAREDDTKFSSTVVCSGVLWGQEVGKVCGGMVTVHACLMRRWLVV